ncbi:hypothetical protein [Devosia sp. Root635]|uniref:hypothetical protein n=1 Tax=Devosia sp. Root635 TaxID=1736575 RepID=UPI0006FB223E|nr:hypothetical protein [Devosia sp. Root635]KRA42226.1 hypothetical protein ASD80_10960 [Devosia sp. Root635]
MKIWAALRNAVIGWTMLLGGKAGWRERFTRTAPGLATALAIFAFVTFLAVIIVAIGTDIPGLFAILAGMFALALPLVAMVLVLLGTRNVVRGTEPVLDLVVPATYALMAFIVIEGLLASLIGGPIVILSWLALGYLLYRLARAATGWPTAISIGFAVLTVLLLVAMRQALYMLSSIAGSPT